MVEIEKVPRGIEEIKAVYGDPDAGDEVNVGWYEENITGFDAPFPMRLSWNNEVIHGFIAHRLVGTVIVDALEEIRDKHGYNFLRDYSLDKFGGIFNYRVKKGGSELSTHAWGIAIDWCPAIGKFGSTYYAERYPKVIVDAFKKRGFTWGGDWKRPDAMHFQACVSY